MTRTDSPRFPLLGIVAVLAALFAVLSFCVVQGWTNALDRQVLQTLRAGLPTLATGESHLSIELMRDVTSLGGIGLIAAASVLLLIYLGMRGLGGALGRWCWWSGARNFRSVC